MQTQVAMDWVDHHNGQLKQSSSARVVLLFSGLLTVDSTIGVVVNIRSGKLMKPHDVEGQI
jgi:hypothetical protein